MTPLAARGFVVGRLPFGNTGLILRWLTAERGRITTMAKGALKADSPFGLHFDLYYFCELQYTPARGGGMHTLREARLVEANLGLRRDYATLLALEYFAAVIEAMTEPDAAVPEDFGLFAKAVEYLNAHSPTRKVVERFERRLLEIHGLAAPDDGDFLFAVRRHQLAVPPQRGRLLRELKE